MVAAVLVLGFAKMDIWDPFNKVAKHGLEYCANGALAAGVSGRRYCVMGL